MNEFVLGGLGFGFFTIFIFIISYLLREKEDKEKMSTWMNIILWFLIMVFGFILVFVVDWGIWN